MPYKRRRRFKTRKKKTAKATANKALKLAKRIASNIEYKTMNTVVSSASQISDAWNPSLINGIARGDGNHDREGNQVTIKSIYWNCLLYADQDQQTRVMVIQDKAPGGTVPALSDILAYAAKPLVFNSMRNLQYTTRFKVLYDKVFSWSLNTHKYRYVKFYKKLNVKSKYEGAGATVAELRANAFYIVLMSEHAQPTNTMVSHVRLRYIDT